MNWKDWRERRGLIQEDVADVLKVSRAHYSRLETGKRSMTLEDAAMLADLFELTSEERAGLLTKKGTTTPADPLADPRQAALPIRSAA